jgi:hypothetical protein
MNMNRKTLLEGKIERKEIVKEIEEMDKEEELPGI